MGFSRSKPVWRSWGPVRLSGVRRPFGAPKFQLILAIRRPCASPPARTHSQQIRLEFSLVIHTHFRHTSSDTNNRKANFLDVRPLWQVIALAHAGYHLGRRKIVIGPSRSVSPSQTWMRWSLRTRYRASVLDCPMRQSASVGAATLAVVRSMPLEIVRLPGTLKRRGTPFHLVPMLPVVSPSGSIA